MKHIIDELEKLQRWAIDIVNEAGDIGMSPHNDGEYISINDLRAFIANSPQADGMVLVPIEPTVEQLEAADKAQFHSVFDMARPIYKAMLSAYKPQADDVRKDAWMPIETAPKDGSQFLAHEDGYGVKICYWSASHDSGIGGFRIVAQHGWRPTLWMPLPQP